MSKVFSALYIEIKLLQRSFWTWSFFVLACSFIFYTFSYFMSENDPGSTLLLTGFIVQAGIFVSMVLGFTLINREEVSSSDEVFETVPLGFLYKVFGKVLVIFFVICILLIFSIVILFTLYYLNDTSQIFYSISVKYLVLYWGISFFISSIIGMIVGSFFQSRFTYVLLVIIWIFVGPLNVSILQLIMAVTKINLTNFLHFINLGQTNISENYNPVYGLPMEFYRWMQKGFILLTVVCCFAVIVVKKLYGNFLKWSVIVLFIYVLSSIPFIIELTQQQQVLLTTNEEGSVIAYDKHFYEMHKTINLQDSVTYSVDSYDIDLNVNKKLFANVKMKITPSQQTNSLIFTLYHDLKVRHIYDENHQELRFEQIGDQTKIYLLTPIQKNVSSSLSIEYDGLSSPYFFANDQAVMLPSYFPWLPTSDAHQAMTYSGNLLKRYSLDPKSEIEYHLRYSGPKKLYTNLSQNGESEWGGKVPDGITIVAGFMQEARVGQTRVIYPASMNHMIYDVPDYLDRMNFAFDEIKKDWSLGYFEKPGELPHTLFFLTIPPETNHMTGNIWYLSDHMIVGIDQEYNNGVLKMENSQVEMLLSSLFRSDNKVDQSVEMNMMFDDTYAYWVNSRTQSNRLSEKSSLVKIQESYEDIGMKKNALIVNGLKEFVDTHKNDPHSLRPFFREWLNLLNGRRSIDWNDISNLLETEKGR